MLTARSIPSALWASARERLIFYFSRRGVNNAEDLAQETLMAVWRREDFQFERQEDFLKVCFGFARYIRHEQYRDQTKHAGNELNDLEPAIRGVRLLEQTEMTLLLKEVLSTATTELSANELALIGAAIDRDANFGVSARNRVRLSRARRKLAKLTGWRR